MEREGFEELFFGKWFEDRRITKFSIFEQIFLFDLIRRFFWIQIRRIFIKSIFIFPHTMWLANKIIAKRFSLITDITVKNQTLSSQNW